MKPIISAELRNIIAEVLSQRVFLPNVSPGSIRIQEPIPGQRFHFQVNLSRHFKVLPPGEVSKKIYEQTGKKAEGVWYLLFGSLTVLDGQLRVHVRLIFIETSEIKRSAHASGDTDEESLKKAFQDAFIGLGINFVA